MKKLASALVAGVMLFTPFAASGTVIFKNPNSPTVHDINEGLQACARGDTANCKYERYPGVVREHDNGIVTKPADPTYILHRDLKPGVALPKIQDPQTLSKLIKRKRVTIVQIEPNKQYRVGDDIVAINQSSVGAFVVVPESVVELGRQNGLSGDEMYVYIETNRIDFGTIDDLREAISRDTQLVLTAALLGNFVTIDQAQVDAKLEELEALLAIQEQTGISNEALTAIIERLQHELETITSDQLLHALTADLVRQEIERIVNADYAEIIAINEQNLSSQQKADALVALAQTNAVIRTAIERSLVAVITGGIDVPDSGFDPDTVDCTTACTSYQIPYVGVVIQDAIDDSGLFDDGVIDYNGRDIAAPWFLDILSSSTVLQEHYDNIRTAAARNFISDDGVVTHYVGFNNERTSITYSAIGQRMFNAGFSSSEWEWVAGPNTIYGLPLHPDFDPDANGGRDYVRIIGDIPSAQQRFVDHWTNAQGRDYQDDRRGYIFTLAVAILEELEFTIEDLIADAYEQGYITGYADGYEQGFDDGYHDGYRDGYADGFVDGVNSVRDTLTSP